MSKETANKRVAVAKLLSCAMSMEASLDDVRRDWPLSDDPSLDAAYAALEHYLVDADIRRKDDRYDERQRLQLNRIIERLAEGQPVEEEDAAFLTPRGVPRRSRGGDGDNDPPDPPTR